MQVEVRLREVLAVLGEYSVGPDAAWPGEPVVPVVDGAGAGARRARAAAAAAAANEARGAGRGGAGGGAIVVRNVSEVSSDVALGIDLDGDGVADVSMAAMVSGRPGVG